MVILVISRGIITGMGEKFTIFCTILQFYFIRNLLFMKIKQNIIHFPYAKCVWTIFFR